MKRKSGKLKLCIVTGSRAEYGLFMPLLKAIKKDTFFELQIIATGMHLSPVFGSTYKEIEKDGYTINEKVEMLSEEDSDAAIVRATGVGMIGFSHVFEQLAPDWVILLGDRFETFAAATAAHLLKIPIAHLHGGEVTEGATDDAMRHAITKMAYLHFTAAEIYRKRVIQLGESPERVFNVGAIGLDNIRQLKLLSKKQLEKQLGISLQSKIFLVTYHPVTLERETAELQVSNLLKAINKFKTHQVIFTFPNADAGGRKIIELIEAFVRRYPERASVFSNLGQVRYLSLLALAELVIGNSSSGIIEAPYLKVPTVNIGDRQKGRLRASSIIDVGNGISDIVKGINKATETSFQKRCQKIQSPYGNGNTALQVLKTIRKYGRMSSVKKSFYTIR